MQNNFDFGYRLFPSFLRFSLEPPTKQHNNRYFHFFFIENLFGVKNTTKLLEKTPNVFLAFTIQEFQVHAIERVGMDDAQSLSVLEQNVSIFPSKGIIYPGEKKIFCGLLKSIFHVKQFSLNVLKNKQ